MRTLVLLTVAFVAAFFALAALRAAADLHENVVYVAFYGLLLWAFLLCVYGLTRFVVWAARR